MTNEQVITRIKHNQMYKDDRETADYIIKALEQQPCDDCENNDGECCRLLFEKSFNKDCVDRQAVKEGMIKYGFHAPDMTITEFIEDELSPVTPSHGTCKDCQHWCHVDGYDSLDTCKLVLRTVHKDFYCADFEKRGNENVSS